jgi:hypothetical protein
MAFKMTISKEAVEGKEVVPAGVYDVRLVGFKPAFTKAKSGDAPNKVYSLNLNARMEIVNNPDYAGRMVFEGLNMNAGWVQSDFCHAFGIPMEFDGTDYSFPGTWDNSPDFDPTKAETYKYEGPLVGQSAKIELAVDSYNNKPNNKVRRYMCSVDDCAVKFPEVKHSTDLLAKK